MNEKPKQRKTGSAVKAVKATPGQGRDKRSLAITEDDVSRRAYARYCARGGGHGHDVDDWLEAERELRTAASIAT